MTGRELIIYILENRLEDEPIFKDGKIVGFMTVDEVAVQLDYGTATVLSMYKCHELDGVKIGDTVYISKNRKLTSLIAARHRTVLCTMAESGTLLRRSNI